MSQGPEGGGGSFRVQSLMMTLWIYIYIVVQRGPGNRLNRSNRSFLLAIVEIITEIVGKQERRKMVFSFLDCGPILSEGPPGGGREGC